MRNTQDPDIKEKLKIIKRLKQDELEEQDVILVQAKEDVRREQVRMWQARGRVRAAYG